MKTWVVLLLLSVSFHVFGEEDPCKTDPHVACIGTLQQWEAMDRRVVQVDANRQAYLIGVMQQLHPGSVAWNTYQLAYVLCEGGQMNSCALGTPIDNCPHACASGKLMMCSTSTKITKSGIVDTIRCSNSRPVSVREPASVVE